MKLSVIRIGTGGAAPGGPPGPRSRRLIGLGLLLGIGLPILIAIGVGFWLYRTFFKVPEFRALLFEGGRVARGAVLPVADGAVVLSQENAQPVAEVIRLGARQSGEARVYLTRLAGPPSEKPRWDVVLDGVTGPDAGQVRVWLDGDRVLVAAGERLQARALATGATLWTATLSDAIQGACRQCLALGGGRVVALTADGVVQAVDATSGRALWRAETGLNRPVLPDLEVAGDLVSVVDRRPDGGGVELALLRVDTGQPVRRIRPTCALREPWLDTTQAEHAGDRVVLALGRAGIAACFQAWDLRRGTRLWEASLPRPGIRIDESRVPWYVADGRSLALGEASIAPSGKGSIWSLAFGTGRLRSLPVSEGYETRVLDARDGCCCCGPPASAAPCGTSSGRWTSMRGPSSGRSRSARLAAPRRAGRPARAPQVWRCSRLSIAPIACRTRRSISGPAARSGASPRRSRAASWEGVAWTDDAAWLTIASPYRVDLRAGAVARAWPWQSLANCQNIGGKIVCTR